jgi:hypothetical protein
VVDAVQEGDDRGAFGEVKRQFEYRHFAFCSPILTSQP